MMDVIALVPSELWGALVAVVAGVWAWSERRGRLRERAEKEREKRRADTQREMRSIEDEVRNADDKDLADRITRPDA